MIIELDTSLANKLSDITINQLVFLTLVLNDNQTNHQDVHSLISRVGEQEIQALIDKNWISVTKTDASVTYNSTDVLNSLIGVEKDYFDEFYNLYPIYVYRPDGTKGFLRANVSKCRNQYKKIVGRSKATHEHIMRCLNFDINQRTTNNNMTYMKTMWKWLVNQEWEVFEEQLKVNTTNKTSTTQKIKLDGFA